MCGIQTVCLIVQYFYRVPEPETDPKLLRSGRVGFESFGSGLEKRLTSSLLLPTNNKTHHNKITEGIIFITIHKSWFYISNNLLLIRNLQYSRQRNFLKLCFSQNLSLMNISRRIGQIFRHFMWNIYDLNNYHLSFRKKINISFCKCENKIFLLKKMWKCI